MDDYSNPDESERKFRVFISYAREDELNAKRLYNDLKNSTLSIEPWLDKEDLLPGQDWNSEIRESIKKSDFFIPLFSKISVEKRGYIQREFKLAVDTLQEIPPDDIFVIPVRLDECEIKYEELKKYQFQDLFPEWYDGLKPIIKSIKSALEKFNKNRQTSDQVQVVQNEILRGSEQATLTVQAEKLRFTGERKIFVGRREYLDDKLKNAIKEPGSRVSLIGPGGSGKSQLAFRALHQYYEKDKIFDLVVPLYLFAAETGHEELKSITISFEKFLNDIVIYLIDKGLLGGLSKQQLEQLDKERCKSIILDFFSKKNHLLLYCDNFETLSSIDPEKDKDTRDIFNFLNNELPSNTTILITSRNRKNFLAGENVIDVEGLPAEEGIKLFIEYASAYRQHLENRNNIELQGLLKIIVTRIGGHPLSIVILAKTYEGKGKTELKKISETLSTEREDHFASEERLKSLRKSLSYSIDKLHPNIQKLLPLLTIFYTPFPSEAVEKVLDITEEQMDVLSDLYNKSLLLRIEEDQYGPLDDKFWLYAIHPAVRNYLEDKYKEEIAKVQEENITYFCDYYSSLIKETYEAWGKVEHRNFIRRFDLITSSTTQQNNDFDRAIQFAENLGSQDVDQRKYGKQLAAIMASKLGGIYKNLGLNEKSLKYHGKSLAICEELNDRVGMASDYNHIGVVFRYKGLPDHALTYHNKALKIHEELNDTVRMARDYNHIGMVYRYKGQLDDALSYLNKALKIHEELNDTERMAKDYKNIGLVYRYKGQLDDALSYHNKALKIHEGLNDTFQMAWDYNNIGSGYRYKGQLDDALSYHNKALKIHGGLNDTVGMARSYGNIGLVYQEKGQLDDALSYHNKALKIHEGLNDTVGMAWDYNNIGSVYRYKGQLDDALSYHNKALKIHEELSDSPGMAWEYCSIGLAYQDKGQLDDALYYHNKALKIHEGLNHRIWLAGDYYNIGMVYLSKKDKNEAQKAADNALKLSREFETEAGNIHPLKDQVEKLLSSINEYST